MTALSQVSLSLRHLQSLTSDHVVTRSLLIANASERPQRRFVLFEDGTEWSYARTLDEAAAAGNALRELGVDQGDRVALIMSNGPDF
ncbi:long-chain fatty acid--CoA ligase, partial [Mycolicibacterium fallax]